MEWGVWRCATGASPRSVCRHQWRLLAVPLLVAAMAGCGSTGENLGPLASARRATIAIESIDGPPQVLARKLAMNLSEEAEARTLLVVPREEIAQYRLRGYLSPHVERGKTVITWVWDVYGADKRRLLRITGDEPSASNSRDAWAAVNDRVLRRIAQIGMDRILGYVNSAEPSQLPAAPDTSPLSTNVAGAPPPS